MYIFITSGASHVLHEKFGLLPMCMTNEGNGRPNDIRQTNKGQTKVLVPAMFTQSTEAYNIVAIVPEVHQHAYAIKV